MQNHKHKLILYGLALGLLGGLVYVGSKGEGRLNQAQTPATSQVQSKGEEQKVLDCAKKIEQDELAMGNTTNDCLFLGCGDFFK